MKLLRLLSWPYLRKRRLRCLLTLSGIVLGVAVFVGMHTANQTVLHGFQATVDRIAGSTELQITSGETGFPEEVLEKVQALDEVRAAAPVIEAVAGTGVAGEGSLLILGVDMTGDRHLRRYDLEGEQDAIADPLVFLAQPDSLMVSQSFAERNRLAAGSRVALETADGVRPFTVRGIMKAGGLAGAFGGNLAVMDIYAAQAVFGRGRLFDRIDVAARDGVSVEECRQAIVRAVGSGLAVESPSSRGRHFESMARGLAISINLSSLFALLVGVFIIYNSFSIAVTERRPEIGILRALGATRGQILALFLGESALAGIIGSAAGLGAGMLLARGMASFMTRLVREVYGTPQTAGDLAVHPWLLGLAFLLGLLASLAGGLIPARNAARVDPIQALQKGRYQVLTAGENRLRRRLAFLLAATAAVCLAAGRSDFVFYTGYIVAVIAGLLLTPALALWLARALRPILRLVRPVEGALAADSLIQSPRRTSATVSALMLSLAIAVGFAGVTSAAYLSVYDWMDATLNPDLFVTPSENLTSQSYRFPPAMIEELARIEGVEEAQPVRNARVLLRGKPVMLISTDVERILPRSRVNAVEGKPEEMFRLAAQGKGVIIAENLALIHNLHLGDTVELASPGGLVRFPVVGVTVDFSDQQGSILMDRDVYLRHWGDPAVNIFRLFLKAGARAQEVKRRILERYGDRRRLFVFTNEYLRAYILRVTDQWFAMTYLQIGVAVVVAILGIANTLTVSITDRRRELGVLQAVGGLRGQVRRTVWLEALAIGAIGLALGIAMGAVTLYYNLQMLARDVAGLRLPYAFPFGFAAALVPVILAAALVSALWPAETAVRASLVESLEYE